jgi:hypothetical protein
MRFRAMENGDVEYLLIDAGNGQPPVFAEWLLTLLANAVFTLHELRLMALAPEAEYAISIRIASRRCPLQLAGIGWLSPTMTPAGTIDLNPLKFPIYSFGAISELHAMHAQVLRDLYDAADDRRDAAMTVEPPLDIQTRWEEAGTPLGTQR